MRVPRGIKIWSHFSSQALGNDGARIVWVLGLITLMDLHVMSQFQSPSLVKPGLEFSLVRWAKVTSTPIRGMAGYWQYHKKRKKEKKKGKTAGENTAIWGDNPNWPVHGTLYTSWPQDLSVKCTGRRDSLRISQLAISICLLKFLKEIEGPLNPMKIK